jgi:hypothetical protein
MTSLTLLGDTSGSIVLNAPAVSGSTTITFAAQSGTLNVGGPAFSAGANTTQSLSGGTFTKVNFGSEDFDTNSNFASSRFTPTVAGYYQLNACVRPNASNGEAQIGIYKNGSNFKAGSNINVSSCTQNGTVVSTLVYANGSTDYFEVYVYLTNSSTGEGSSGSTWFNGCLVRSA